MAMTQDKSNRIFWQGMHVVLTRTELPRLRALGFEVFNPPYLADVYDQSAVTNWDASQPTTLPADVFAELSRYNFFYNRISPRIAELLNEYFGTVIVTISPTWLAPMLEAFRGRIIYRVFGQMGTACEGLWSMRLFRAIQERSDFCFVPHAEEAVRDEHAWLKERMAVVPYTLPLDVFAHEGTWAPDEPHEREIMACCPNIDNPYYSAHYQYLNAHFPESYIKLYGVQPRRFDDPRVVGTLGRHELLDRYRRASGYWYHYDTPTVCYLPPVEMMTVGGPVVYMKGSLLARYFESRGPGEAASVKDAKRKLRRLISGDRGFLDELRLAQRQIVRRYHPDFVHPVFDRTFRQLIQRSDAPRREAVVLDVGQPPSRRKRVYVFFHLPGEHVTFHDGIYEASDELARSVAGTVHALLEDTDHEVVVTCFSGQLQHAFGLLRAEAFPGRVRFLVLDPEQLAADGLQVLVAAARDVGSQLRKNGEQVAVRTAAALQTTASFVSRPISRPLDADRPRRIALKCLEFVGRRRILFAVLLALARFAVRMIRTRRRVRVWAGAWKTRARTWLARRWRAIRAPDHWVRRRDCVAGINADSRDTVVIVPRGDAFPEALFLERPLVLVADEKTGAEEIAPQKGLRGKFSAMVGRYLDEKAAEVIASGQIGQSLLLAASASFDLRQHRTAAARPAECERWVVHDSRAEPEPRRKPAAVLGRRAPNG